MAGMRNDDRHRLTVRVTEAITSAICALQADPDEEYAPLAVGSTLAHVAITTIEQAGFQIVRRPRD